MYVFQRQEERRKKGGREEEGDGEQLPTLKCVGGTILQPDSYRASVELTGFKEVQQELELVYAQSCVSMCKMHKERRKKDLLFIV